MKNEASYTRRRFLRNLAAGGIILGAGPLNHLTWASQSSTTGTLRVLFYTDIHTRVEWDTPIALDRATAAINAQKADVIIAGGDLITDGFQNSAQTVAHRWDAYMKLHQGIHGDVHPVIGNHDLVAAIPEDGSPPSKDPRAIYRDKMELAQTYYSFDAVGHHLIILDSIHVTFDRLHYEGRIWPEQMEWLKEDLAKTPKGTPIVLCTHIPLLTTFFAATQGATTASPRSRVVVNNVEVLELFKEHNLILVLQGHLHVNELMRWRETTFITGGAVCARWWRGPNLGTEEGFGVVTLSEDHVEWEYIDYGWEARRPRQG